MTARRNALLRYPALAARILLFVYVACLGYTVRYHIAAVDLDGAWAVGLNYAQTHGFIHNRDIAFTYGPLSYLVLPMAMGSNLGQGILFQLFFWLAFIALAVWIAFIRSVPLPNLLIFALCLFPGFRLFWSFGYAGPDFFLGFIVLLLVAATADASRWWLFWIPAVALAALLAMIKLSTGISAISAVLTFPLAMFVADRRKALLLSVTAVAGFPVLFVSGYLFYHPSFASLAEYLKAGFETSAGHSTAMSYPGDGTALPVALAMMAGFIILAAALYISKQSSFATAVACFGPIFLEFKHSFIREPGHVEILFSFAPLALLAILLFVDLARIPRFLVPVAALLIAGVWLYREAPLYAWTDLPIAPVQRMRAFAQLFDYPALQRSLTASTAQSLQSKRLPATLLQRISDHGVTIIPSQCAYGAANTINYIPLRTLQSDQAYTEYLDAWTAKMFENSGAPEFVLFEWESIDGRHPLLDIPQTALGMYRNYEWDSSYDNLVLLRRRRAPLDPTLRLLQTSEIRLGDPLHFPVSAHPIIAKVFVKFNLLGRLKDFLFRIPEVRAVLASEGARVITARVPPLVLPGGVPVNLLPHDFGEFQSLFRDDTLTEPATSFVISGEGISAFQSNARVEVYEAAGINIKYSISPAADFSKLTSQGILQDARIETLNNTGVIAISEREVVDVKDPTGTLDVSGWAVNAGAVYVQLDGKLYPARYGQPRQDIFILYRTPEAAKSGYSWSFPSWKLGNAEHEITLKIINRSADSYYDVSKRVRFRIVH